MSSPDRSSSAVPMNQMETGQFSRVKKKKKEEEEASNLVSCKNIFRSAPTSLFLRVDCIGAVHDLPLHLLFVEVDDVGQAVVGLQDLRCGKSQEKHCLQFSFCLAQMHSLDPNVSY